MKQWRNTGGQCTTSSATSKSISFVSLFYYSYHLRSTLPPPPFPISHPDSLPLLDWWVFPASYCLCTQRTALALSSHQHWFGIPGLLESIEFVWFMTQERGGNYSVIPPSFHLKLDWRGFDWCRHLVVMHRHGFTMPPKKKKIKKKCFSCTFCLWKNVFKKTNKKNLNNPRVKI